MAMTSSSRGLSWDRMRWFLTIYRRPEAREITDQTPALIWRAPSKTDWMERVEKNPAR